MQWNVPDSVVGIEMALQDVLNGHGTPQQKLTFLQNNQDGQCALQFELVLILMDIYKNEPWTKVAQVLIDSINNNNIVDGVTVQGALQSILSHYTGAAALNEKTPAYKALLDEFCSRNQQLNTLLPQNFNRQQNINNIKNFVQGDRKTIQSLANGYIAILGENQEVSDKICAEVARRQVNPNQPPAIHNEGIRNLSVHKEEPMYADSPLLYRNIIKKQMRNQQKDMNSNIISLLEDSKIPNQYGDVSRRNWFTNVTISRNPDTVFIFGGNVGHIQNRALGGGGQAAATAGRQNVLPIITTGNYTDSTQVQIYHQKIKNILEEYVQNGGKVVFPTKLATQVDVDLLNREGCNVNIGDEIVNVGTGLAAGNYITGTRAFAQHLFEGLKKIPVQSVGKYGSCIDYVHQQMNKLEVGFQKPTYKAEYLQQNQRKRPDDRNKIAQQQFFKDTNNNDKFAKIFNTLLAKNKFQRLTVKKIIKVFKDAEKWGSYTGYLKKYSYKQMKELFSNARLKGMRRKEFAHEARQIRNERSTPEQRAFSVAFSKIKDDNGNNLSTSSFFQNFEGNSKQEKTDNMIKFVKSAVQNLRR